MTRESAESRRRATFNARARAAVMLGLLFFVAGQGLFRWSLAWHPMIGDLDFGRKLVDLRSKVVDPNRQSLLVMLGSSRVATGFRPEVLPRMTEPDGRTIVGFNFAQIGTGPQLAHLVLQRMLDQGLRPDRVLIEFWPPLWASNGYLRGYVDPINLSTLDLSAVRLLARYLPKPRQLYAMWLPAQLAPIFTSRFVLLSRLGKSWAPDFDPDRRLENLDASGWWAPRETVSDDDRRKLIAHYEGIYAKRLVDFRVFPTPDAALQNMLTLCKSKGIKAAVIVLPEADSFRALYSPASTAAVDAYLARLAKDVPVIDARRWVAESGFSDGHHLLPTGAALFTERLGRDGLPRLLKPSTHVRAECNVATSSRTGP